MSLPQRLQAIDSNLLHVRLALTNGYFSADTGKTVFEPTASFSNSFHDSTEVAKRILVDSINKAFRSYDKEILLNLPMEEQKELRKGIDKGMMVFNKSKKRLRPRLDEMKL